MKKYETKVQELDVHRKEIIQMVKTGSSQKEIAEKYETWPSTVRYWFRKQDWKQGIHRLSRMSKMQTTARIKKWCKMGNLPWKW